jgi:hypothetical protein
MIWKDERTRRERGGSGEDVLRRLDAAFCVDANNQSKVWHLVFVDWFHPPSLGYRYAMHA